MKKRKVEVSVSDHAVLRWLEREHDLDITSVRAHIRGVVQSGAEYHALSVRLGRVKFMLRDLELPNDADDAKQAVVVTTLLNRRTTYVR